MNRNTTILIIGVLRGLLFTIFTLEVKLIIMLNIFLILLSLGLIELFTINVKGSKQLEILEINQNRNMRCLKVTMVNNNLLEGEDLFKGIYKTLMENKDFLNFGFQKIIILSVVLVTNKEYNLHSNVLINNESNFNEYYSTISHELDRYNNLQYGYHNEEISRYVMLAWNVDNEKNLLIKQTYTTNRLNPKKVNGGLTNHRSYSTYTNKWYKGLINPISLYNKKGILKQQHAKPFFTMDVETVYLESVKSEVVIAISSCGFNNGVLDNQIFLIDPNLLLINYELASHELWNKYFKYLKSVIDNNITIEGKLVIFAHNLGNFDGYFLFRGLMSCYNPDHVNSIVDESNTFISITATTLGGGDLIEWKDSLRIFPSSLNEVCKMFGVDGKFTAYNPKFKTLDFFNNSELVQEFINYSLQDAKSLFQALFTAQHMYFNKFKVDIESVYSTATLSLKIYRTKFQEDPIFILPSNIDSVTRSSYYGGGTEILVHGCI
jgi:hypothetical protein